MITDRPGNVLKRNDGTIIAAATPKADQAQLGLAFLAQQHYANGQPVAQDDYLDEVGSDYVAQSRQIRSRPGYRDRVHGRVASSGGSTWLQYWFFMYYDDPGFLGFGTHEGDIEMIQLQLDGHDQPAAASYSQHKSGVKASFRQLEWAESPDGPVPVAYSARGSHANLLRAGQQLSDLTPVPDHNDGQGHRARPDVIVLSDTAAPWSLWPGVWGSTRAGGRRFRGHSRRRRAVHARRSATGDHAVGRGHRGIGHDRATGGPGGHSGRGARHGALRRRHRERNRASRS